MERIIPPTLTLNKETGCYEGTLLVQVPKELFSRMLWKEIEEDEVADLTDVSTWAGAIARMARIARWLDKPNVKITPIALTPPAPAVVTGAVGDLVRPPAFNLPEKPPTKAQMVERRLWEKVRHIAPHLWNDVCRTPIADMSVEKVKRENVGRLRYEEKLILERFLEEYDRGDFEIDAEAEEAERLYRENQRATLNGTVEAVAVALEATRIH
jgi:hypothetical protein